MIADIFGPARIRFSRWSNVRRRALAMLPVVLLLAAGAESRASAASRAPADSTAGSAAAAADSGGVPQRDLFDVAAHLFHPSRTMSEFVRKPSPGLTFTLLPSVGYNPAYGGYLGVSASVGGWLGDPETTTLSAGAAGVSYSTTKQLSVYVKSDFYLSGNAFALKGDWRYLDTSQSTYGLGPATDEQLEDPMTFVLYRFYQAGYWRVSESSFYVGLGYQFNRWDKIVETNAVPGVVTPYQEYSGGPVSRATTSGISFNVLHDSRDNPIDAQSGTYWNASLRPCLKWMGSDDNWQALWSDFRAYPHLPGKSKNTLAIWTYQWLTFGHAPYLDLPATGWDTYGRGARGYLMGRIRGDNQIYTELEYRADLRRDGLLGGVVFLNFTATTSQETGNFARMDPGFGAGVRLKFRKRTSTNLAVDGAWDQFGVGHVFFGMQEAF